MPSKSTILRTPAPAQRKVEYKLTYKQWSVFYYLISICEWNGRDRENHYYVYKDKLNISQASKKLNISRSTFYSALDKLSSKSLSAIVDGGDYYTINIPRIYAEIDRETLQFLILQTRFLGIDFIRVYALLMRIYQFDSDRCFVIRDLVLILGHNENDTGAYEKIRIYLALLEHWGLIELRFKTLHSDFKGTYKEYTLIAAHYFKEIKDKDFLDPGEYMAPQTLEENIFKEAMKEIGEDPLSYLN